MAESCKTCSIPTYKAPGRGDRELSPDTWALAHLIDSTFWANSSPRQLFEALAWGKSLIQRPVANMLVVIDEIEKGCSRNLQYDP